MQAAATMPGKAAGLLETDLQDQDVFRCQSNVRRKAEPGCRAQNCGYHEVPHPQCGFERSDSWA